LWFDVEAAKRAIAFFGLLQLAEGEFAGKAFVLQPWQEFIVGSLFGWKGRDGLRRFRLAYIEIGKGNGKTPMAAGIGLYLLTADGEASAQVYAAAVKIDQAKIAWNDARKMVEASESLRSRIEITSNNLAFHATESFFRAISSEKKGLDGPRVHGAIIDEIHEHPDDTVVEKIRKGAKGRRQPLIVMTTNAGINRESVCWHYHTYAEQVLTGALENDEFFPFVCGLDPCARCLKDGHTQPKPGCGKCDDWTDEGVWSKPNPNLGVSVTLRYLRGEVREALDMPHKRNITLRLNFCIWTQQSSLWIPLDRWDECDLTPGPSPSSGEGRRTGPEPTMARLERLRGQRCWGGLDLSTRTDLSSFCLRFEEDEEGVVEALSWFWVPEENIELRVRRDQVPYDRWVQDGWIAVTPGAIIDYDVIREFILDEVAGVVQIEEIGFDPWNATQFATQLMEAGAKVVEVRQGFLSLSEPSKSWEALIVSKRERHGGHPVMRWMVGHLSREEDAAGNIKPSKKRSPERIDGPVARIIAESCAVRALGPVATGISLYVPGEA